MIVAYAVRAKAVASGTYQKLGAYEPGQCGYYERLVAESGQPGHVKLTGCVIFNSGNMPVGAA